MVEVPVSIAAGSPTVAENPPNEIDSSVVSQASTKLA
jgi:hypothetical protein